MEVIRLEQANNLRELTKTAIGGTSQWGKPETEQKQTQDFAVVTGYHFYCIEKWHHRKFFLKLKKNKEKGGKNGIVRPTCSYRKEYGQTEGRSYHKPNGEYSQRNPK